MTERDRTMTEKRQRRGPETISDALDALERSRWYRVDDAPTWIRRGLSPDVEGVALRWRIGKDLTNA